MTPLLTLGYGARSMPQEISPMVATFTYNLLVKTNKLFWATFSLLCNQ